MSRPLSVTLRQRDVLALAIAKQLRMIERGTMARGLTGIVPTLKKLGTSLWRVARTIERLEAR